VLAEFRLRVAGAGVLDRLHRTPRSEGYEKLQLLGVLGQRFAQADR
jgi:hypothetical protein